MLDIWDSLGDSLAHCLGDCLQSGQIYKRNLGQNENVFLVQGVINKFIT